MRMCIFEDAAAAQLAPLALTRPVCDLRCGAFSLLERQCRYFAADEVSLLVRPWLCDWCRFLYPGLPVNEDSPAGGDPILFVNARWLPPSRPPSEAIETPHVGLIDGEVAYLVVPPALLLNCPSFRLTEQISTWKDAFRQVAAGGHLVRYLWHLLESNGELLGRDFQVYRDWTPRAAPTALLQVLGPPEQLLVGAGADIHPFVVVDTQPGPVLIDQGATVRSFSYLQGPCYIGRDSQLLGASVRNSAIGPQCRIGGEVEASVVQGYTNKAHDGFLGHSYLGEWINFGAGTQTSDLRNDYQTVRILCGGRKVDTGLVKLGAFLGDHSKTGLGTLLNPGTVVGCCCTLFAADTLVPRDIPSFCTLRDGCLREEVDLRRLFHTAAAVIARRGHSWTEAHTQLYLALHERTAWQRRETLFASEGTLPPAANKSQD